MKYLIAAFILFFSIQINGQVNNQQSDFLVKPYLQIGKSPTPQSLQLLWHTTVSDDEWLVEYLPASPSLKLQRSKAGQAGKNNTGEWIKAENQTTLKVAVADNDPFKIYNASFTALVPGITFNYRVSKNGKIVFEAEAKSLKTPEQSYRIAVTGDIAAGTKAAGKIANRIYNSNPDLVAIAGDIVYTQGLISEYKTKFWPVYNKDIADTTGAPLLRSIPFAGAVGNHDADTRDLDRFPGALAYYHFWDQPLNGPHW